MNKLVLLGGILLLAACSKQPTAVPEIKGEHYSGQMINIVGDHFQLSTMPKIKMRLWGAMTCQKNQKAYAAYGLLEWPCGTVAATLFKSKFNNKLVTCYPKQKMNRSKYFVQCFADGKDIAVELIKSGWAIAYRPYHKVQEPMYLKYEDEARSQNKGIWGSGFHWPHTYRKFGNKHVKTAPIKTPY